ncbi:FecCD family ABC transporter permease [Singulisphaera sp. PoT]|uniref:FecCD family ABC transporter permease n=1 Tax=Singulisphaera sp. PoT TaxID=3411797 RepID=UPI003BF4ACC7
MTIAALLGLAYAVLALLGTIWGSVSIPTSHVARVLASAIGLDLGGGSPVPATERFLILQVRLPQVFLLGLVGAALATSGAALQATFENPLADPSILGVSGGAALGAVLAIHSGIAETVFLSLPLCAFCGGLASSMFVYAITYFEGHSTGPTLLLTGVAVGSMTIAGVSLVMVITEVHRIQELLFWMVGGVRNQSWEHVGLCALPIALGIAGLLSLHHRLDALLLGEEQAMAVGVPVAGTRLLVLLLTALATGAATAVSGSIGFVGLMVPHLIRRLTGPRTRDLLPACVTGGAAFLTACDLFARSVSGTFTLHLGIITALLGGPAFLIVLRKSKGGSRP